MPYYKIWLKDKRQTVVQGDAIELVSHMGQGHHPGDLLVKKGGKVVALFRHAEVSGYSEHDDNPEIPLIG